MGVAFNVPPLIADPNTAHTVFLAFPALPGVGSSNRTSFPFLIIALLGLSGPQWAVAQCQLLTSSSQTTITCGSCVTLSAFGNGTGNVAFSEDFNSGAPVGWQFTQSAQFNNPCGPGNGTPHLWMGQGSINPRTMVTNPLDLTLGGNICFDMRFAIQGDDSPCEGPDEPQEGVFLDYSINGGANWITINYFDPNGGYDPQLTNWNTWCFAIPAGAQTPATLIRWHQNDVSDDINDHWGIDDIEITLNDPNYGITWLHDGYSYGLGSGGGANPTPICPLTTTTYTAIITDGTNTCTDEVTINVVDPVIIFDMGPDEDICQGDCVTLNASAYHQVSPASTPTFSNNQIDLVVGGNASVNINVQGLNMAGLIDGSITQACINGFNFTGSSICFNFGGCPCNGATVPFGGTCDLNPGSFTLTLNAPNGCGSIILAPQGIASGNYNNTCFIPVGGSLLAPPFPGVGPYAPNQPFSNLNGCDPNGVWSATFNAPGLGIGVGLLSGWSISFDDPEIVGPVIFSWDPTTNMTDADTFTPTVCPTATTTYTLSATNQVGCNVFSEPITVNVENCCALSITASESTPASCVADDGTITITGIADEVGTVTYSLDGGPEQLSATFTGLAPGIYTVTVNDDVNCPVNVNVEVEAAEGPEIADITTGAPSCGADDGTILIDAVGNGLQYSVDGGLTFQTDPQFNDLAAGIYDLQVSDANGCISDSSLVISAPDAPEIQNVVEEGTTCGINNGAMIITATGNAPLSYSIDGGATVQASATFSDLAAGTYIITVIDADDCEAAIDATIDGSAPPTIDQVDTVDPTCGVVDGSITITATGIGLQYSLNGGLNFQAGNTFSNLGSGSYVVVVLDAFGCTGTQTVDLNAIDGLAIDDVSTVAATCGLADGSITVLATGSGLNYSIDGGVTQQVSGVFASLPTGTYTVTVIDDIGCTSTATATVNELAGPSITDVATTDPACGQSDGVIVVTASDPAVQYSVNNGATYQASNTFNGLPPGNYQVLISLNGCTDQVTVDLASTPPPAINTITPALPLCAGDSNGGFSITATGSAPLQYSIDGGTNFQVENSFTGLPTGTYSVFVTDPAGCSTQQDFVLNQPAPLTLQMNVQAPNCSGDCTGTATAQPSGGTPGFSYAWSQGLAGPAAAQATNVCAGSYQLTITDAVGCIAQADFTLEEPLPFVIESIAATAVSCPGLCDGTVVVSAPGATAYSLNGGLPQIGPVFSNVCPGAQQVTAANSSGCFAQADVNVAPGLPVVAGFTATPAAATTLNPHFELTNTSVNGVEYLWDLGPLGTSTDVDIAVSLPETPGETTVCLTTTNSQGCTDRYCSALIVLLDFALYVPNAFTPDGDGVNDEFFVVGDPILNMNFELLIFDRWGELIHSSNDLTKPWDGRYGGTDCMQGQYVWRVSVKDPYTAEVRSFKGHVSLFR